MSKTTFQGVQKITIDQDRDGQRIDNYLFKQLRRVPKSHVYRLIRKGEVRVNGKRIKAHYHLSCGDIVRIPPLEMAPEKTTLRLDHALQTQLEQAILFEDDDLLVINKPAGMAVHGGSTINNGLIDAIKALRPDSKSLELAHRLDKPTSGCLIITKKMSVLRAIHEQIRQHEIKKQYLAIVAGAWPASLNKINVPLIKNVLNSGARIVRVDPEGKPSLTTFAVIEKYREATLISANLKTGRTHQIRVHCQYAKHPILGDAKYMSRAQLNHFKDAGKVTGLCLHAKQVSFVHPTTHKRLTILANAPETFEKVLQSLIH